MKNSPRASNLTADSPGAASFIAYSGARQKKCESISRAQLEPYDLLRPISPASRIYPIEFRGRAKEPADEPVFTNKPLAKALRLGKA